MPRKEGDETWAMFYRSALQQSETLIDDRACECCATTAAVTSDAPIAFRNRTEDEIRDIYVPRFVNGKGTEPVAVHRDNSHIVACPVNGPALRAGTAAPRRGNRLVYGYW
jgi:hypothetical protein